MDQSQDELRHVGVLRWENNNICKADLLLLQYSSKKKKRKEEYQKEKTRFESTFLCGIPAIGMINNKETNKKFSYQLSLSLSLSGLKAIKLRTYFHRLSSLQLS